MTRAFITSIFLLSAIIFCQAQEDLPSFEKTLQEQSTTLLTDTILDNRINAGEQVMSTLKTALVLENSFEFKWVEPAKL